MSAPTLQPKAALPQPVAGPLFRRAAALDVGGQKRRKVLALVAAYIDAGEGCPTVDDLAERTGLSVGKVGALLGALEDDGWLKRRRKRPRRIVLGEWAQ